ncbi:unnamed protein product [Prorocentrum cordatum]|uniref:Uncharacterized protein n=1 Tax=Prorocentrum cordatum TaxID=2364126 RepID=A0ABN9U0Y3_9DINO|nr:unnamed protein product [Polarella glacialis]
MLVAKAEPTNWSVPSLLLRYVDENRSDAVFVVIGEALEQFRSCEVWRVDEFTVLGSNVRNSSGVQKFGVQCLYEVSLKFVAPDLKLAGRTWPFKYAYAFQDWPSMNQLDAGAFVDILGKLEAKPVLDANSSIPKPFSD